MCIRDRLGIGLLHGLHGIARQVEQDAEQLIVIGLDGKSALDRADPADRSIGAKPEGFVYLLYKRFEKYFTCLLYTSRCV